MKKVILALAAVCLLSACNKSKDKLYTCSYKSEYYDTATGTNTGTDFSKESDLLMSDTEKIAHENKYTKTFIQTANNGSETTVVNSSTCIEQ